MSETNKKVALVTGGSRGIGRAIVVGLAEAGYDVAFTYASNKASAEEVESTVRVFGRNALALQADVSDPANAQYAIDEVTSKLGRLDVLVNNAGITRDNLMIRIKEEDWQKVIDTNLSGAFYLMKLAGKVMMKQRSGSIVNITSISGIYGNAGQVNYAASKAGLIGMTKSAAKELGSRGITVNAVAPGFIATDMTGELDTDKIAEHIPLGRIGSPEDIANAVVFLVTSGSYITGQVLQVDGGLVL